MHNSILRLLTFTYGSGPFSFSLGSFSNRTFIVYWRLTKNAETQHRNISKLDLQDSSVQWLYQLSFTRKKIINSSIEVQLIIQWVSSLIGILWKPTWTLIRLARCVLALNDMVQKRDKRQKKDTHFAFFILTNIS